MSNLRDADRIRFHADDQIMECDFSDKTFDVAKTVNDFYDELERQIGATGLKWFFLVNYFNCKIMTEAWITFAHRGKKLNLAYSLGTARFAASADTSEVILEDSKEQNFDPNLFASRKDAVAYLQGQRAEIAPDDYQAAITKEAEAPERPLEERILFHADQGILEVDFSEVTFERSRDVDRFYEAIEKQLAESGRKWFFLVNYRDCVIMPEAWYRWASWSKRLNGDYSLGTVRFNARDETTKALETRAQAQEATSNIVSSRDEALAALAKMRRARSA